MVDWKSIEDIFHRHGLEDFQRIEPRKIIVSSWVRMKCRFGCPDYGRVAACPPQVPSVEDCRLFFHDYDAAVVFHFQKTVPKPEDRYAWTRSLNQELLKVERDVFVAGHRKAFLLFLDSCNLCAECSGKRESCKLPYQARPTPEALGVDVYETVSRLGYPIQVLRDYDEAMNRYSFLLIE